MGRSKVSGKGTNRMGKQGTEVWGLILCKVPSGMVHMRECFHCPPPELFVEFVEKRRTQRLPELLLSPYRGRDVDGGDGGNDGFDGSHCPPPGWVHYLLPNLDKQFL